MIIFNQVYISQCFLLLIALLHDAVVRVLSLIRNFFARERLSVNVFVSISSWETGWYFFSMEFRRYVPVGSHPWPFLDDNKANTASESVENRCY